MARPAWGAPSDIAVRVSCSVLSEVSAAEFEARAKLDLAARTSRGGELEVVCDDLAAKIRWRERGGLWVTHAVPRAPAPPALVDALLDASKEVVEATARETSNVASSANESPSDAQATPIGDAASEDAAARDRKAKERAATPAARDEGASPRSDPAATSTSAPLGRWGLSVGSQALFFASQATGLGMMGPNVGVYAKLPWFVAHLEGEYHFTFGEGDQLSVRVANASGLVLFPIDGARAFELGGGIFAGGVFAEGLGALTPRTQAEWFWGATARARVSLETGGWRLAVGPDIRFYGARPQIAIDGAEVWGLPVFAAGIVVEVFRDLYGAR